jgi:hypothetical protein
MQTMTANPTPLAYDERSFKIGGQRQFLACGEIHYAGKPLGVPGLGMSSCVFAMMTRRFGVKALTGRW